MLLQYVFTDKLNKDECVRSMRLDYNEFCWSDLLRNEIKADVSIHLICHEIMEMDNNKMKYIQCSIICSTQQGHFGFF